MRMKQTATRTAEGRGGHQWERKDKVRLVQLLVCILIFLAVFIGRGVFPHRIASTREQILALIRSDIDLRGALETLGTSLGRSGSALDGLEEFYVQVFGPIRGEEEVKQAGAVISTLERCTQQEIRFLSSKADPAAQAAHLLRLEQLPPEWQVTEGDRQIPRPQVEPEPEPEPAPAVAAVGTVLLKANYSGKALPAKYTMDELSLGQLETSAPLKGTVHSGYGYRDHPINGKYSFHGGLDIGGQKGDPIKAFAAGTVEYIGENDAYGLYVQLDHGNGVKSFYAHCSKLLVKAGQSVAKGETIARVGNTGRSTGPHVHFEIRYNGQTVNPLNYINK